MHQIEVITEDIAQELKEGSISFQIYAYPPNMDKLASNDGGAAIKRRMTIKQQQRAVYDIDAEKEAKLLGLHGDDQESVTTKSGSGQNQVALVKKEDSVCCNVF